MRHLFDRDMAEDIKQRTMRLGSESQRQWGTMPVGHMLAHCTCAIEMAAGVITPKRATFPANVIGTVIKPLVFRNDRPMRRNSPSSPELFPAGPLRCVFERERDRLISTIDRFVSQGPTRCSQHAHPFFGSLTPNEWAILTYKHLDHHLRQFGV